MLQPTGQQVWGSRRAAEDASAGAFGSLQGARGAVVASECLWFVCGPSVRVRLQKAKVGPYWPGLLANKRKMAQLKVDWASWLDEDEEHERSSAPNGTATRRRHEASRERPHVACCRAAHRARRAGAHAGGCHWAGSA